MKKKLPGIFFITFLLLAVAGTSAFSVAEFFRYDDITENSRTALNDDGILRSRALAWSVTSSPLLRNGARCLFISPEAINIPAYLAETSFQIIVRNYIPNKKDTILLKLLI